MKFFSFKKKPKEKEDKTAPLILTKLDRIIELLEQQQKETGGKNINLEHVQIDHLENIIFRMDNIEIDELSGKLLIGTNISGTEEFASSFITKSDKQNAKKEAMAEEIPAKQRIKETPTGFRFRTGR